MDVMEAMDGRPENVMSQAEIVAAVRGAEDPAAKLGELFADRMVTFGLRRDIKAVLAGKIEWDQVGTDWWLDGRELTDPEAPKGEKVARSAAVPKPGKAAKAAKVAKVADAAPA